MIYAQIKDGAVANTIVLDDPSLAGLFSAGFDSLIRVDNIVPQPGTGWLYDGSVFSPDTVEVPVDELQQQINELTEKLEELTVKVDDIINA